jgi:hypothetical protein
MTMQSFGQKVKGFKRYSKAERWIGQARLPEHRYIAHAFEYDYEQPGAVDGFIIGTVMARDVATDKVAPYVEGDARYGVPFGICLEPQDIETDLMTSVYLKGAWDTSVVPIQGIDVTDAAALRKLNATCVHGLLYWDTTLPTPA